MPTDQEELLKLYTELSHTEQSRLIELAREMTLKRKREKDEAFERWVKKYAGSIKSDLTTDQIMQMTRGEE